jgi:ATP-dependent Lon protease
VGALPGRIIQALKKVGTRNPVLVLDEVDKMGADVRGDPAAALLEVLDPEQNTTFTDHYIDLPFDLSQVLFLATANYWGGIPEALRDRLEIIEVPGYTRNEKLGIAKQFLVPKQLREHGLTEERLRFSDEGLECIVDAYTREAGVRGLEREIAAICRAMTVKLADGKDIDGTVAERELVVELLGPAKVHPEIAERKLFPGLATSISVSSTGGDLLLVEATLMPGKGGIQLTGGLGNVLREAAETAITYVRSRAERLNLAPNWLENKDLHVHVPRAAYGVDSASAGLAVYAAVVSLLLRCRLKPKLALVGEMTLRGAVLPVTQVKDILLAAHRGGVNTVLLPEGNLRDLDEVPQEILNEVTVHGIHNVATVLELVLDPNGLVPDDSMHDEDDARPSMPSHP